MGEWLFFIFALGALILAVIVWGFYVYPFELVNSIFDKIFFRKKEWWQDKVKRVEKENEKMITSAKAKKG